MASEYLTVIEVLAIHSILIDEFGGTDGVRDMGALEAAAFRPQTGYYQGSMAEAAALMESLLQNHAFLDGNKRVAVAAADVHLRMNGLELAGDSMEHFRFIIDGIQAGTIDRPAIEQWLRANAENSSFGVAPDFSVPSRDEWDRGRQDALPRKQQMGRDLSSPLTEDETRWLDEDLDA